MAGRRSHLEEVLGALLPNATPSVNVGPRYCDARLLASCAASDAHELRRLLLPSDDWLELVFENPADFDPNTEGDTLDPSPLAGPR